MLEVRKREFPHRAIDRTSESQARIVRLRDRSPASVLAENSQHVVIIADGLEIYGATLLASGTATANLVPNQKTAVTVTLRGIAAACPADGGAADAASSCDGSADAAPP